jgi:hypothetical protein
MGRLGAIESLTESIVGDDDVPDNTSKFKGTIMPGGDGKGYEALDGSRLRCSVGRLPGERAMNLLLDTHNRANSWSCEHCSNWLGHPRRCCIVP